MHFKYLLSNLDLLGEVLTAYAKHPKRYIESNEGSSPYSNENGHFQPKT